MKFIEMTDNEYSHFTERCILSYSQDLIKSGLSSKEAALNDAKNAVSELIPQGKQTEDSFIYKVINSENEYVGTIWYKEHETETEVIAFICDFLIFKEFRKRGYGRQTLLLLEDEVKKKGNKKNIASRFCLQQNSNFSI